MNPRSLVAENEAAKQRAATFADAAAHTAGTRIGTENIE